MASTNTRGIVSKGRIKHSDLSQMNDLDEPPDEAKDEPIPEEEEAYDLNDSYTFRLLNHVQGVSRFFTGFTLPESDVLSTHLQVLSPRKDEVVVKWNSRSEWFGVVCRGYLRTEIDGTKKQYVKVGEMIGDTQLFTQEESDYILTNASARTVILYLPYTSLSTINKAHPDLGLKLYQVCGRSASMQLRRTIMTALGVEEFPKNNLNSEAGTEHLVKDLRKLHIKTRCFGHHFTEFDSQVVIQNMYFCYLKAGSPVYHRGQAAKFVTLVMKGKLEGKVDGPKSRTVFVSKPGEFVGEEEFILSFFDDTFLCTRTYDVSCKTDAVLAILSKPLWEKMNEEEPEVAWKLLRQMTAVTVLALSRKRNLAWKFDNERLERLKRGIQAAQMEEYHDDFQEDDDEDEDEDDDLIDDLDADRESSAAPREGLLKNPAATLCGPYSLTTDLQKFTLQEGAGDLDAEEGCFSPAMDILAPLSPGVKSETFVSRHHKSLSLTRQTNLSLASMPVADERLEDDPSTEDPPEEDEAEQEVGKPRNVKFKFRAAAKMIMARAHATIERKLETDMLKGSIDATKQKTKQELMKMYNMGFGFGKVEDAAEFTPSDVFELMMYAASFSQYWRGFLSGELEVLCQLVILQRVQRGEQMLVMGEAASFFGLVLSGRVKIYDKRHDLTRYIDKGSLFGNSELCVGGVRFYDAWAEEECMIGIFAYADIIHLNISCPELGCKVFQKLTYAAVHELREDVNGISEMERLQVPPPGSEPMDEQQADALAHQVGTTVLGKRLPHKSVRELMSFFSPPRLMHRGERVLRNRQYSSGVLMVLDGVVESKIDRIDTRTTVKTVGGNVVGEMGLLQVHGFNANLVRQYNYFVTSETATVTLLTFDRLTDLNVENPELARDVFFNIIHKYIVDLQAQLLKAKTTKARRDNPDLVPKPKPKQTVPAVDKALDKKLQAVTSRLYDEPPARDAVPQPEPTKPSRRPSKTAKAVVERPTSKPRIVFAKKDYSVVESRYKQEVPGFMKAVTREQRSSYEPRPNVNVILSGNAPPRMELTRMLSISGETLDPSPKRSSSGRGDDANPTSPPRSSPSHVRGGPHDVWARPQGLGSARTSSFRTHRHPEQDPEIVTTTFSATSPDENSWGDACAAPVLGLFPDPEQSPVSKPPRAQCLHPPQPLTQPQLDARTQYYDQRCLKLQGDTHLAPHYPPGGRAPRQIGLRIQSAHVDPRTPLGQQRRNETESPSQGSRRMYPSLSKRGVRSAVPGGRVPLPKKTGDEENDLAWNGITWVPNPLDPNQMYFDPVSHAPQALNKAVVFPPNSVQALPLGRARSSPRPMYTNIPSPRRVASTRQHRATNNHENNDARPGTAPAPFGGDFGLHPQEGSGGPVQCFLPFSTGSSRGNAEPTKSITQRVCASTVPMKRPAVVQFGIPVRFSVEAVSSMPHVQSTQHPTQGHGETISISGAHGAVAVPMHTQQLFGPSGENANFNQSDVLAGLEHGIPRQHFIEKPVNPKYRNTQQLVVHEKHYNSQRYNPSMSQATRREDVLLHRERPSTSGRPWHAPPPSNLHGRPGPRAPAHTRISIRLRQSYTRPTVSSASRRNSTQEMQHVASTWEQHRAAATYFPHTRQGVKFDAPMQMPYIGAQQW